MRLMTTNNKVTNKQNKQQNNIVCRPIHHPTPPSLLCSSNIILQSTLFTPTPLRVTQSEADLSSVI